MRLILNNFKNHANKIIFLFLFLLIPISLSAQAMSKEERAKRSREGREFDKKYDAEIEARKAGKTGPLEEERQAQLAEERKQSEERQKAEQEKVAKRKQELTAKYGAANAEKIMSRNFEIGMTETICNEVCKEAHYSTTVVDKSANAETWEIKHLDYVNNRWVVKGYTYLYFSGKKLVRIRRE